MRNNKTLTPGAIKAESAAPRTRLSNCPEPFFSRTKGREKQQLGDLFGLKSFGVSTWLFTHKDGRPY
jgi:uncharacterized cupin superfamily protein